MYPVFLRLLSDIGREAFGKGESCKFGPILLNLLFRLVKSYFDTGKSVFWSF